MLLAMPPSLCFAPNLINIIKGTPSLNMLLRIVFDNPTESERMGMFLAILRD